MISGEEIKDNAAIDEFAALMKEKMKRSREKGRYGWELPTTSNELLSNMLHEHTFKANGDKAGGDALDVAILAMMIHMRGERINVTEQSA